LISDRLLFRSDQTSFATGSARYVDADPEYPGTDARIVVRVGIDRIHDPVLAVVDTAAPWCIFEPVVAAALRRTFLPSDEGVVLSTRLGRFGGTLYRGSITLVAEQGENLDVDATVFISPDWRGPNFLGYEGFLQRIRFAVDPENNLFYFGRI
jgi:hypothetical protein